ncbi:hypothetical protein Anas_01952, partial [Armadillidium nasatum]
TFYFTNPTGATCKTKDGRDGFCLFQGCFVNDLEYHGRCAFGLASCCLAQSSCEKKTNANNTYFVNPSFPLPTTSLGTCTMEVKRRTNNICQIRLDFVDFNLEQPNPDGNCFNDAFKVEGARHRVPTLCGNNKGQHMYFEVEPNDIETPLILSVTVKDITLTQRSWNIKISMIECTSPEKAPPGCLQYYSGAEGLVKSFNFGLDTEEISRNSDLVSSSSVSSGTRQLANTDYTVCVRQEREYCSLSWMRNEEDGLFGFTVNGDVSKVDLKDLGSPILDSTTCGNNDDLVYIPNGVDEEGERSERHCGLGFPVNVTSVGVIFKLQSL